MTYRTTIALVLACAAGGGAFWFALRQRGPASVPVPLPGSVSPGAVAQAAPPITSHAKLVTVMGTPGPGQVQPASLPRKSRGDARIVADFRQAAAARIEAINHLPAALTEAGWRTLREFLLKKDPLDDGQLGQSIKNQLMDRLCELSPPPPGLGDALIQVYRDRAQNAVLRDYAVQHLAVFYEQAGESGGEAARREQAAVERVLWGALEETEGSIAGTALIALERLSQDGAEIDRGRMGEAALKLANDGAAGELTRITAYQVCGRLEVREALPAIRAAAQNSPAIPVKISAIGALGMLGGAADAGLVERLSGEGRLKPAALHALEQLAARETFQRN